jgi:hypothetical protein
MEKIIQKESVLVEDSRGMLLVLDKLPSLNEHYIHTTIYSSQRLLLPAGAVLSIIEGKVSLHSEKLSFSNRSFIITRPYGLLIETSKDFLGNLIYSVEDALDEIY